MFGDDVVTDPATHGTASHVYTVPGHYMAIARVFLENHAEIFSITQEVYIQGKYCAFYMLQL